MSNKVLTVSVAAYKVEKTLRETLESLVVPEIMDKLEVFVVDDGGTDGSLAIAKEFEERYPGTFHAVHKENGGYGSTVNWSLAHATGKYFKLLDGDDWYVTENLAAHVETLETADTDTVITPYILRNIRTDELKLCLLCNNSNGTYPFRDVLICDYFRMYCLAYKTEFLRHIGLCLFEHCMYTDNQYSYYPLRYINTAFCWSTPVYIYRTGLAGQTMSISGQLKYSNDFVKTFWWMFSQYCDCGNDEYIHAFYEKLLALKVWQYIRLWCWMEPSDENKKSLKSFVDRLKKEAPEVLSAAMRQSKLVFALVSTNFIIYPFVHRYCLWKARRSRGGGD